MQQSLSQPGKTAIRVLKFPRDDLVDQLMRRQILVRWQMLNKTM